VRFLDSPSRIILRSQSYLRALALLRGQPAFASEAADSLSPQAGSLTAVTDSLVSIGGLGLSAVLPIPRPPPTSQHDTSSSAVAGAMVSLFGRECAARAWGSAPAVRERMLDVRRATLSEATRIVRAALGNGLVVPAWAAMIHALRVHMQAQSASTIASSVAGDEHSDAIDIARSAPRIPVRRSSFAGILGAAASLGTRASGQILEIDYAMKVANRAAMLTKFDDGSTLQDATMRLGQSPMLHPPGMTPSLRRGLENPPGTVPRLRLESLGLEEASADRRFDADAVADASPPLLPASTPAESLAGTPAMALPAMHAGFAGSSTVLNHHEETDVPIH